MIILMKLLEKNKDFLIYSYGYDEKNLDGKIKVNLKEPYDYEVIQESTDNRVGKIGTLKAIIKIIKSIKVGEIKEILNYQS